MSWEAAAFIGSYPSPYNTRRDSDFDNYTTTYTCNYKISKIMFTTITHTHNHIYMQLQDKEDNVLTTITHTHTTTYTC